MSDALFRLVGDGDRHSGGAIPLPEAFAVVVNHLIDHGSTSITHLSRLVADTLAYKEERIMAAAWRSWEAFTRDILSVLEEMNLVKGNLSWWELTEEFVPNYTFHLPGTDIPFTGRPAADRERRHHNETLYMTLTPVLEVLRDKSTFSASPEARQMILEAEQILIRELQLGREPQVKEESRYRRQHPRKPHEERKRLRHGMAAFARDDFWVKYAVPGTWYDIIDVARKFEELHPEQPPVSDHADSMGSMRKSCSDLVKQGKLDGQVVQVNGTRRREFRLQTQPGYQPGAIIQIPKPVVTWEDIKRGPKA
jgi:hypothetical protein